MAYHIDATSIAKRSLKNVCLRYLGFTGSEEVLKLIEEQYYQTDNMTDRMAALQAVNNINNPLREKLLLHFSTQWHKETLVLDKWFALQAVSELPDTIERVKELLHHPYFLAENPNKLYALLVSFSHRNPYYFHEKEGKGYRLIADEVIRIDAFNPQVAARLVTAFTRWRNYDENRQSLMKQELHRILEHPHLSSDVYELASKSLE
jgi:aminopeptidase N